MKEKCKMQNSKFKNEGINIQASPYNDNLIMMIIFFLCKKETQIQERSVK